MLRSSQSLVLLLRLEEHGPVNQHPAHEAAHLFHGREFHPLVGFRIIGLDAAEDGLVLAEASADVDPALVGDHGTAEPGFVHGGDAGPFVGARTVTFH